MSQMKLSIIIICEASAPAFVKSFSYYVGVSFIHCALGGSRGFWIPTATTPHLEKDSIVASSSPQDDAGTMAPGALQLTVKEHFPQVLKFVSVLSGLETIVGEFRKEIVLIL
jgi:hypothetical protein